MNNTKKTWALINLSTGYALFISIGTANGLQPVIWAWAIGITTYAAGAYMLFSKETEAKQ